MLNSDLTIVGTDQLFNELMGRFYQDKFQQVPQVVMTTKITPGTDGVEKQSKSLGNYIALSDTPRDKFGKIMRLPDMLIEPYLRVYTLVDEQEIEVLSREIIFNQLNPMEAKKKLATALVERYHGVEAAEQEREWFQQTFSARKAPTEIPVVEISSILSLLNVLQQCLPGESRAALRRLVQQNGVRLNEAILSKPEEVPSLQTGDVLKVGKRHWFKILLKL